MARYNIKRLTPQTHYKASIMLYNLKRGIIPDYVTWEVKEEHIKILELLIIEGMSAREIGDKQLLISKRGKPIDSDTICYWFRKYVPYKKYDTKPSYVRRNNDKEEYKLFAKLKAEIPKICCASCGATDNLEMDHIKPLCRGGKTEKDNLQWLCHKCHVNKTKQEFGWDKPFGELPDLAI